MNNTLEKLPYLLRKFIARYIEDPSAFNFMDSRNEIWISIHNCHYSVKFCIEDQIRFNARVVSDSHDLWVSYEFERLLKKMYIDPQLLRNKIRIDFNYSNDYTFMLIFQIDTKKPETIFTLSETNTEEWISEKLSGDYGKLYKILKENSPVDLTELTQKTRFLTKDIRKKFLEEMIKESLIYTKKVAAASRKTKNIFIINENKMFESIVKTESVPEINIETTDKPMPERFNEMPYDIELNNEMKKKKSRQVKLKESGVDFHETTLIKSLFSVAGKAIEYIYQIFPGLSYVIKITIHDESYTVMEFKAKRHTLTTGMYIENEYPEKFYERVMQKPYKNFIYGYLEFIRAEHSEYRGPYLYDGTHHVNGKEVFIEIDFKPSQRYDSNAILDTLPEKIEEYFNMEDSQ